MRTASVLLAAGAAFCLSTAPALADRLDDVRGRDFLQCGVADGALGFSARDEANNWSGFDVDFCRAMAAAIFNDPGKVRFTALSANERFAALTSGSVDVLSRSATWTMARDTGLGIKFVAVSYYDGQGFLVRASTGAASALDLGGLRICVEDGTAAHGTAVDYFASVSAEPTLVARAGAEEVTKAYADGECDVLTAKASVLASVRAQLATPDQHVVLPDIIAKEPMGPVVARGDDRWFSIARWTLFAMLEAEELGVTQSNIDELVGTDNAAVRRLLGVEGNYGAPVGLSQGWAYQIIRHVGNYGEVFDRNIGSGTPIGLTRGLNALWRDGGLQYAPPIR